MRRLLLCAGLAPALAIAGWAMHRAVTPRDQRRAEPASSAPIMGSGAAPRLDVSRSPSPSAGKGRVSLRYSFDGDLGERVRDADNRLPLSPREAEGGELTAVPHDGGLAVRFSARCEQYCADSCARAILQSGPAEFLNPGRADFTYGASVLVQPDETSKGANVVRKGFSVGDSQFKLQVDGEAGRPGCVIVGTASDAIFVALASRSVSDGRWHRIACSRSSALLTVAVDGTEAGRTAIPSSLTITNHEPLCIGGKGTSPNNDQFIGVIDDVYVTRGA